MGDFVHLHLHTEYSLLDGATRISSIADKALALGQDAVAITDHGVMYGAVEFYTALKEKGVKPIIGCEVYVAPRSRHLKEGKGDSSGNHLILLCKNDVGYRNLSYMVSMSFIDGFYSKPRIDIDLLREHSEGLVALSACLAGKIPQLILSGSMKEAEAAALEMRDIFGDDFYLELQNHGLDDERRVNFGLKLISDKYGIPLVATNDVHYLERSDAETQATLMCIQMNTQITDGRPLGFETDEFYFKSSEEMKVLFAPFKDAIENTVKIAEKCNFDFEFDNLHLPDFRPEGGVSHADKLRNDAYDGFNLKIKQGRIAFDRHSREEYEERIEYELSVIDKMGFNAYFLIVSDFVTYAKGRGIPVGPGRGSGAGSLVAFLIGITDVDPISFDLLFERFLNPERVSMPDFDIDFCYNRREEVIDYVKSKYGDDRVAQIVTFGTLAPRAAVRDVGRALGMPYNKVDTVAKLIPREAQSIEEAVSTAELKELYTSDEEITKLIDLSMKLEGMPRHASTHAAGVVMTEKPTYEYVPLSYSGTGVVTQFDMNTDAKLGLVKFDFLGLRYLTVIQDAVNEIRKHTPDFDISKIDYDDKATFNLLCEAKTDGVFQLESGGMKQVLSKLAPSCLEDIIACVALYRPGPMDSIDSFIARKHGIEKVEYEISALKEILDVTYGCIVYQEQVMQICRSLAGYSYARADIVRRAMSKKKTSAMQAERDAFVSGCVERGVEKILAEKIFEEMLGFAKYAFNKSHATAYGIISYRTAYLKAHYPAEYFTALLTSVLDSAGKVREYITDAARFGVKVLPPDINESEETFSSNGKTIRFGLIAIKNVGRNFAKSVIKTRSASKYLSFDDFISRLIDYDLNKRTVESLIKCGAFDSLGITRSSLMNCYESIIESEHDRMRNNIRGQMDLFSQSIDDFSSKPSYDYPKIKEYSLRELLLLEKESSGMYFSGHLIDGYARHLSTISVDNISEIIEATSDDEIDNSSKYQDKATVKIAGVITQKRTKATKNGGVMAFLTVEDRYAEIEVIVFSKKYTQFSDILLTDEAVIVTGNISTEEGEAPRILLSSAEHLIPDSEYSDAVKQERRLYIKVKTLSDSRINNLKRMIALNRGNAKVVLFDESTKKYCAMKDVMIDPSEHVLSRLVVLFGEENVIFK
ncbi:MAG: DNA polymerase III subunit alpha [Clostridia bacterium]|nr:DNA polymerase III subunit alpha [Clostridia bacterium]